jgi:Na+-translocating ferredoxin:NAD+ oxidoreductase RnfG subunit
MKYIFLTLLSLVAIFPGLLPVKDQIDYRDKSLLKALKKGDIESFENLNEISLSDSVANNNILGKFFQVDENIDGDYAYVYVGRVNSCRAGGCSTNASTDIQENSEYFDYFILFDKKKSVRMVKVFNYQATHGQEITSRGWLRQFRGHRENDKLVVDKTIDSISGATISVYAITADIKEKTILLNTL